MHSAYKINIALFICFAFIFRLLFVNIGVTSSLNVKQNQNNAFVKKQVSSTTNFEPLNNSSDLMYSSLDMLEEDSSDENQFKLSAFVLSYVFYFNEHKIENVFKKLTSFNRYFSYNASYRYLEYRVFRI